jgi:hypothetical protein
LLSVSSQGAKRKKREAKRGAPPERFMHLMSSQALGLSTISEKNDVARRIKTRQ